MRTSFLMRAVLLMLCIAVMPLVSSEAEARSKTVSNSVSGALYYEWTSPAWGYFGWSQGLFDPSYTVEYRANIYNDDTGELLLPNDTVPVGTHLRFETSLGDITWNGTGTSWDTPYGVWKSGAAFPDGPTYTFSYSGLTFRGAQCSAGYYMASVPYFNNSTLHAYIPFAVDPPMPTISRDAASQANLSCVGNICTVIGTGDINTNFVFPQTYGKFWYEYRLAGCHSSWNEVPMKQATSGSQSCMGSYCWYTSTPGGPDTFNVPQAVIPYTLTASPGALNNPPTAPTIVPDPLNDYLTAAFNFSNQVFAVTATDPDNDTIRYLIDWDNNDIPDQVVPSFGYVASGAARNISMDWIDPGTHVFQVMAEDRWGANSGWVEHSVTLVDPVPCALPWGGTIPTSTAFQDMTVTAYQSAIVPFGDSCVSEIRKCSNGVLSGSYTNQKCIPLDSNGVPRCSYTSWDLQADISGIGGAIDVAFGNGIFVALAGGGFSLTSVNGVDWEKHNLPAAVAGDVWTSITYGNGKFVAVAYSVGNHVITSPDGINWTVGTTPNAGNQWTSDIAYGNGMFVTVRGRGSNRLLTSPDAVTWTERATPNVFWRSVTFGNNKFVAGSCGIDTADNDGCGDSVGNRIMTSPDGINWTVQSLPTLALNTAHWNSITFGDGHFTAWHSTHDIATSPDGVTWTERGIPAWNLDGSAIGYGDNVFVTLGSSWDGVIAVSSDSSASTWNEFVPFAGSSWLDFWGGIAYGNNTFVAVGDHLGDEMIMTSSCVAPAPPKTLKLCQDACDSGLQRSGFMNTIAQGDTRTYVACHNAAPDCSDPSGETVATWTDEGTAPVSLQGANPASRIDIHGDASGIESVTADIGGGITSSGALAIPVFCFSQCTAEAAGHCSDENGDGSFSTTDSCGIAESCPAGTGTKNCGGDTFWREVAP